MLLPLRIVVLLAFISSAAYSQSIQTIEIKGSKSFSESEIADWGKVLPGTTYTDSIVAMLIKNIHSELADRGYLNSVITEYSTQLSADSQTVSVKMVLDEGEPSFINKIIITDTDSSVITSIYANLEFLEGEIFNKFSIEENLSELLTYYENNGYPFTRIIISSVYFYEDSVNNENYADVYFTIEKGEGKSKIDKIEISGASSTKDYVITRELRIEQGAEYSQLVIDEIPSRLNRLRFFDPVNTPQYFINSDGEGVLVVNVIDKQTNNFDGIVGYIPGRTADEKGYITGLVNVTMRNLFGTGRAAAIRWQQFDRYSQELELRYLEPWLLGYPFNINFNIFQRKQDTTYVQRKFEGGIEYLATHEISAAVFASTEQVIPAVAEGLPFTVFNASSVTTGINLKYDSRDDPYAPTEGLFFLTSYSFSRKKINGPTQFIYSGLETRINLQRVTLDFNFFYQVFNRHIIALGVHGRELKGSFFEDSDLFRLGGTNTLRGYREDQFLGSRVGWTNIEYRLLLTRRSFAFVFFDAGYYLRNEDPGNNILKQEGIKPGYGLGLNLETALGVLSVSFALGEGDSFSDGKIHFGIVNEF